MDIHGTTPLVEMQLQLCLPITIRLLLRVACEKNNEVAYSDKQEKHLRKLRL